MKTWLLGALALFAPAPAMAAPVIIAFNGAQSGHSVSGQLSYDTSVKPLNSTTTDAVSVAAYLSGAVSMLVDGRQWNISNGISIISDSPAGSVVGDTFSNSANFSGSGRDLYDLTFNGPSTMLSSSALPPSPLLISSGSFHWLCRDCDNFPSGSTVEFTLPLSFTILTSGVPEPATWGMMILGIGMVGGAMRRPKVRTAVSVA